MVDSASDKGVENNAIDNLLNWLGTFKGFQNKGIVKFAERGRGLFVERDVYPGETLLVIPAPSLLNPLTILKSPLNTIPTELFPLPSCTSSPPRRSSQGNARFTTTQLLTLHCALSQDPKGRHKSEWQIFLDSLPSFRPWHPLTWVVPNSEEEHPDLFWPRLESCLSASVRMKINEVKKRYEADLALIRNVLATEEPFKSQHMNDVLSDEVLLWGWLNVNTRTVSMPLGLAEPPLTPWPVNNHSFIPLLDMINHSSLSDIVCPKPEPVPSASSSVSKRPLRNGMRNVRAHLIPGKVDLCLNAPPGGLKEGEEILFMYGPHSNPSLFADYGFTEIDEVTEPCMWPNADVDVTPWVNQLWQDSGAPDEWKEALEQAGLWNHNRLAANGGDYAPSLGLMSTLCCMCSPPQSHFTPENLRGRMFGRNAKDAARRQVQRICQSIIADIEDRHEDIGKFAAQAGSDQDKLQGLSTVRALLREERIIAQGVLELIESGGAIYGFWGVGLP